MKPLHYYFLGTGAWFLFYGIHTVSFAWIVTIVLNESATMVALAQMGFLIPATLLMLIGGSLADQLGGRKVAIIGHVMASIAPLFLSLVVYLDYLTFGMVLVFAVIMGCAQALVTPARDGLLALVAEGQIQQRVVQVSMIQFGIQMLGFFAASFADQLGILYILGLQFALLFFGTITFIKLKVPHTAPDRLGNSMFKQVAISMGEGFRTVVASPSMRAVVIQNCAMGVFFMGSYMVTVPIMIREVFAGSSAELSWVNIANSLGLVTMTFLLMRMSDIQRQGRALLVAQGFGAICLFTAGLNLGFHAFIFSIFCWGMFGGIAMTMSRTIMQQQAPIDQRARMMGFYSFSFMGSGPIGALLSGIMVEYFGPQTAIIISCTGMLCVVLIVSSRSSLWHLDVREL